jgi:hypothetical protein
MMTIKPGCRGDPRMNGAVTAKLEDPSLSLYDALQIGGFNYPRNVDAATIDNDRVTLGQRKNQLNRRLRLARQNLQNAAADSDEASGNFTPPSNRAETVKRPATTLGSGSPLAVAGSYLRQQQRLRKSGTKATASKRCAPVDEKDDLPAKKQCLPGAVTSSKANLIPATKEPKTVFDGISATLTDARNDSASLFNAISQNNLAESLQRGIGSVSPAAGDFSWAILPDGSTALAQLDDERWWPVSTNNQVGDTCVFSQGIVGNQVNLVLNDQIFVVPQNATAASGASGANYARSVSSFPSMINSQDRCTGVGQQCHEQHPTKVMEAKEELALRIFSANLRGLYQKSMIAAGFTLQESSYSSQPFQSFAFQAWKRECERLQVLLKDHVVAPQSF